MPNVRSILSHEFVQALDSKDAPALAAQIGALKAEQTPAAGWAEALGTRLQIRDFLMRQKGGIAELAGNKNPDLRQNVTGYLQKMDIQLGTLTGFSSEHKTTANPQLLKAERLDRLAREPAESLFELADGFATQDISRIVTGDQLVERTVRIRGGITEQLWSAAQTHLEGDRAGAQEELNTGLIAVNDDLDRQIRTVLIWEPAQ